MVRIRVLAGAVTVEAWAVVVIRIVLPCKVLVKTIVEAGKVVCIVEAARVWVCVRGDWVCVIVDTNWVETMVLR